MGRYFSIGFIYFMSKGKSLLEYTNFFSPEEYKKNDKMLLKYFQQNQNKVKIMKIYCNICNEYRKLKKNNILYIFKETVLLFTISVAMKMKRYLKIIFNRNIKNSWFHY